MLKMTKRFKYGVAAFATGISAAVLPGVVMAQENTAPVWVSDVSVEKLKEGKFKITAKGTAPTPGWKIELKPVVYIQEPTDWRIEAVGRRPPGMVAQVITDWQCSLEMGLGTKTKHITVAGRDKEIRKEVPH